MITVLLADDHPVVSRGLASLLRSETDLSIIDVVASGRDALLSISKQTPMIVVTDLMLGDMTGVELCYRIKQEHPAVMVLVLSMIDDPAQIRETIQLGAEGYILKTDDPTEVARGIHEVYRQRIPFFYKSVLRLFVADPKPTSDTDALPTLTQRELEILILIVNEKTKETIAEQLFISIDTVETHRRNLMKKICVKSAIGLTNFAHRHGLIS